VEGKREGGVSKKKKSREVNRGGDGRKIRK